MNTRNAFSSTQKENSKALLRELLMDNLLRSAPDTVTTEDLRLPSGTVLPSPFPVPDEPVSTGQIRLLSQIGFPTYIAVLDAWDGSSFLIAPFSRFSKPATEEELTISRDGGAFMNVLQIWNARTAMDVTLRKSWLVGILPEKDVKDALLLWKWSIGDVAELPERISERTGVPIYRTDDPRLEYRREALENFATFDAEDDANAERTNRILNYQVLDMFRERPSLAAGDKRKGTSGTKSIPRMNCRIDYDYSPSEDKVYFVVCGPDGKEDEKTLEGFVVVGSDGSPIGTIKNGTVAVDAESVKSGYDLQDPATQNSVFDDSPSSESNGY